MVCRWFTNCKYLPFMLCWWVWSHVVLLLISDWMIYIANDNRALDWNTGDLGPWANYFATSCLGFPIVTFGLEWSSSVKKNGPYFVKCWVSLPLGYLSNAQDRFLWKLSNVFFILSLVHEIKRGANKCTLSSFVLIGSVSTVPQQIIKCMHARTFDTAPVINELCIQLNVNWLQAWLRTTLWVRICDSSTQASTAGHQEKAAAASLTKYSPDFWVSGDSSKLRINSLILYRFWETGSAGSKALPSDVLAN